MSIEKDRLNAKVRLEILRGKLEMDGQYVGANTCTVALDRLSEHRSFIETVELYLREDTLCRRLTDTESALAKAAKALLE